MLDSGSSSNFVAADFVRRYQLRTTRLTEEQSVSLADGKVYRVREAVLNAGVCWEGWEGKVTLLVLPLISNDVILGMAWLARYNPQIDWKRGTCIATPPHTPQAQVQSTRIAGKWGKDSGRDSHHLSKLAMSDGSSTDQQSQSQEKAQEISRGVLCLLTAKQWRKEMRNGGAGGMVILRQHSETGESVHDHGQAQLHGRNDQGLTLHNIVNRRRPENFMQKMLDRVLEDYDDVFPEDLPAGLPLDGQWIIVLICSLVLLPLLALLIALPQLIPLN